jgi:hypothetical protein
LAVGTVYVTRRMSHLPARRQPRDFERQLLSEGRRKRLIAAGDDEKRAWAADYIDTVPVLYPWFVTGGYRQTVHGEPV